MAIRVYKPTSPARRFMSVLTYEEVTKTAPEKSLLESKKKNAGRNKQGKITVRHQGGGNKIKYRVIDFKRNKDGIPAKVAGIEYDPNRTAFIALLNYADGEKRYILAPIDLKTGDTVISGEGADIKPGNALPIRNIPLGTLIHNIEICLLYTSIRSSILTSRRAHWTRKWFRRCWTSWSSWDTTTSRWSWSRTRWGLRGRLPTGWSFATADIFWNRARRSISSRTRRTNGQRRFYPRF